MSATVLLKDIVDALEMQSDDWLSFVDLDTGQVETVSRDLLSKAEEAEDEDEELDVPEWQQPEWELAKRIIFTDRFVRLPDKFRVRECSEALAEIARDWCEENQVAWR